MACIAKRRRSLGVGAVSLTLVALGLLFPLASAQAAPEDPLFTFTPQPAGPPPIVPPPTGYLNGPCGVAVNDLARPLIADHYHDVVDVFGSNTSYIDQQSAPNPLGGPCALALDSDKNLYVGDYHGSVRRYGPYPDFTPGPTIAAGPTTGLAVDLATDEVYVNERTHVSVYDSSGAPIGRVGEGSLEDGYGIAVSAFPGSVPFPTPTAGFLYVPDAETNTVKVYDPATDAVNPVASIAGPPGGFVSLRDSAVAVDDLSGDVYVLDNLQPAGAEQPRGRVHVFDAAGAYEGHLKYDVVHGEPSGLAVDNSDPRFGTQGRVYVTSGNTDRAGIYVYPPDAATGAAPLEPTIPSLPAGGDSLFPAVPIGSAAAPGSGIACEGDACQILPPEPVDPTLTTLLAGPGNPRARYRRYARNCAPLARDARKLRRRANRARRDSERSLASSLSKRARRAERLVRRCRRANRASAGASAALSQSVAGGIGPASQFSAPSQGGQEAAQDGALSASTGLGALGLLPGAAGFDVLVQAADGSPATPAGSHPYRLEFALGLDQGGGDGHLRELEIDLPAGLLVNPAALDLCQSADFGTPRSSPYEVSESGESCPERTQVGTVEVRTGAGGGETRSFGLFNLEPADGTVLRLGAAPFGHPLLFDAHLRAGGEDAFGLTLVADVPQALEAEALGLSLWGVPWDASHNTRRGNCLNEAEPDFAWSKCTVGEPVTFLPRALLTLPTECGAPLAFDARASSWQGAGAHSASAAGPSPGDCGRLTFRPNPEALLSVKKASSSSGFVFRLFNADDALVHPRLRIRSHPERAVVRLPRGVTLNPSLGAGLVGCAPGELAAETPFNPPGAGCPNGSKIGVFSVRVPFYQGLLRGSIYLAKPDHPASGAPGAENPFDSLLAVYLVAKSAQRGILIRVPGELARDPGDGTLTATFDGLPQIPYTDLEVNFRSGQRAPLVSPPSCGPATTRIEITPSSGGAIDVSETDSVVDSGIDFGPCPGGGASPFAPGATAGGVNSNVGSYTPYFIHLSRKDTEQEITSYSLVLPKGITGKIADIPFCPDAAIAAARGRQGFDEIANPSCPAASQVGRTDTGHGVGAALTYAPGRIYLAGPYGGSPLSLVTINAATVGPFDLGTIVIRSAFDIDERTAQLQIDSSVSDPIPHIIDGVPLHLRDIRIHMDRFQFTHNPSSCEASQLVSTLTGSGASFATPADDSTATVGKHFQLLNCLTVGFRPRLGLRLRGAARRGGYPSLRASFVSRGARDSNLKRIEVEMPHSLFLAQNHIRTVCTREQFATERCPEGSIYGTAMAQTLLFDTPLRGNVYLRSSSNKLPDLVADLRSGSIRIVVEGRIGPGRHGGIRTFFDNLPDAPIDRFTMTLHGGRRGLLQNSSNICKSPPLATVSALGQNNIGARFSSVLRGQCKGKGKRAGRGGRGR